MDGGAMRHSRMLRTALVGLVLAAGLAGCKIPGTTDAADKPGSAPTVSLTPQQLVSNASRKSRDVSTARFTMKMVTSAADGKTNIYAVGQLDNAKPAISMTMKMALPGLGKLTMRQRLIGGQFYLSGIPGAGRKWVKVDAAQAKSLNQSSTGSNPAEQLALFESLSEGVSNEGPATVHGVRTTKYSGKLNLDQPAAPDESAEVKRVREDMAAAGISTMPFNFYIDEEGLPARMVTSMTSTDASSGKAKVVIVMDFTDWGAPVTIVAPADAVTSSKLTGAGA